MGHINLINCFSYKLRPKLLFYENVNVDVISAQKNLTDRQDLRKKD